MKKSSFLPLLLLAFSISGCSWLRDSNAADPENVGKSTPNFVVNYGNGIYFFPYTGSDFGNACSQFLGQHPELEIAGIAIDEEKDAAQKRANGYFVYFRKKCP